MRRFFRAKTERVGAFPFFDLLKHEVVDPETRAARDAYTFACPDWVSIAAVTREGQFVMVRQYRYGIDAASLEVAGGMIDPGEAPAVAAMRELREETGYGGGVLLSLGSTYPNPVLQDNRHHMYLVRDARRLGEPELDEGEHCEVVIVESAQLRAFTRDGTISHALVLLTLARALETLSNESEARFEAPRDLGSEP
jgi:8-oxo-dGTP pyrophosphatase MutT (NUDIX family)